MPDGPRIFKDLVVVASLVGLVAEEVDRLVVHTIRPLGLRLDMLQTVGLVPASREDIKRDLSADGVPESRHV